VNDNFTDLFVKNQNIVHKICSVYFNGKPDKEDYFQEIIIQLWKAFPGFRKESKFSTWMYRVALNTAIDLLRKEKSQPKLFQLSKSELSIKETKKELTEQQEKLYAAISQLSEIEKAIIILYLEDYSYKEISEIVGISETYTGVKINRIKTQLQTMIKNGN
jgi:RNA polymerase sigma-70 factor (ECF subfamily)